MTDGRRRVVRLALQLHEAGVRPILIGGTYAAMESDLEKQWIEIARRRRNEVRRKANRLISRAGGLKNAGDQLVMRPLPQKSTTINPQIECTPTLALYLAETRLATISCFPVSLLLRMAADAKWPQPGRSFSPHSHVFIFELFCNGATDMVSPLRDGTWRLINQVRKRRIQVT